MANRPPSHRRGYSPLPLGLLAALAFTSPVTHAQLPPQNGSFAAGNLNVSAPYGIPPSEFGSVTQRFDALATFNITGYNVSSNATTPPPEPIAGWTLSAGVTFDVSLIDAAESSQFDIEATTLLLVPPVDTVLDPTSWSLCAVVFPEVRPNGTLGAMTNSSTPIDGGCENVLSSECIQDIAAGTSGMDANGTCGQYTLPDSCASFFPVELMNNTAITINQTVLDDKRFYAYGSPPTQTANQTAYLVAVQQVWPVITLFGQLGDGTTLSSLNTAVQCIRAFDGTTDPDPVLDAAGGLLPSPWLAAATAGFVLLVPYLGIF